MPRYVYLCDSCEEVFEQTHSMKVKLEDCHLCGSQDCLKRLPSSVRFINYKNPDKANVGSVVKQHIQEAKEDIKQEKREMGREWES
jgi:putative FmdB family regulatory protein